GAPGPVEREGASRPSAQGGQLASARCALADGEGVTALADGEGVTALADGEGVTDSPADHPPADQPAGRGQADGQRGALLGHVRDAHLADRTDAADADRNRATPALPVPQGWSVVAAARAASISLVRTTP